MDIVIRKVLVEEAYAYAVCHAKCWQAAYRNIMPDDYLDNMLSDIEQAVERTKKSIIESNGDEYICVTHNGNMIGKLGFGKSHDESKDEAGQIYAIYLIEEFWDKGYGRIMMDHALAKLRSMHFLEVIIWVLDDNSRARRFYEKFGFKFDGATEEIIIGKPLVQVRYSLDLL